MSDQAPRLIEDLHVTTWNEPVDQWKWSTRIRFAWWALTKSPRCVRFTQPDRTTHFYGYYMDGDYS